MDKAQQQHFREILERQYAEVNEAINLDQAGAQTSDGGVGDVGDASVESLLRDNSLRMGNQHTDRMREIERAMQRIDRGEYGICDRCGEEIDARRLEALPTARTCTDCAEDASAPTPPTL